MNSRQIKILGLVLLLIHGLGSAAQETAPITSFASQNMEGLVFDANFKFRHHAFSGLFVVNTTDEALRIDLLSKTGMTLATCILSPDSAVWDKFIPGADKSKRYVEAAEKSFRIATLAGLTNPRKVRIRKNGDFVCKGKMKVLYRVNPEQTTVISAKEKGWFKLFRRKAEFEYRPNDNMPIAIGLSHSLLNFDIDLKRLDN